MDKIWDRNPSKSEVIGRCRDKTNDNAEPQKKRTITKIGLVTIWIIHNSCFELLSSILN